MWAGGRIAFRAPLRHRRGADAPLDASPTCEKRGQERRRWYSCACSHEIARMPAAPRSSKNTTSSIAKCRSPAMPPRRGPPPTSSSAPRHADPVLLFRYSALTFNGHRIHYDLRYVTRGRGLSGPDRARSADRDVAAGPAARASARRQRRSASRSGAAPAVRHRAVHGVRQGPTADAAALWARGDDGALAMEAAATLAEDEGGQPKRSCRHPRRRARAVPRVSRRVLPQGRRRARAIPKRSSTR